jgi:hypothetical protein
MTALSGPAVLVHGDLHGDNQVCDHRKLRLMASPPPRVSTQIQPPDTTNPQVSLMYSPRAHNREPSQEAREGLWQAARACRANAAVAMRFEISGIMSEIAAYGTP